MRKDMAQLLVERRRLHRGEQYRGHRRKLNRDPDAGTTKQGMRRPYVERKHFNEYFPPLIGYLRKNVGRPWDKVFSELNASLSGGGTIIDHVKMHVFQDFVILNPVWHNGVPCYPYDSYWGNRSEPVPIGRNRNGGFYVDQHGALQRARHKPRWKYKPKAPARIPIDNHTAYHKIDGHWYRVWTKELGEPTVESVPLYDVLLRVWVRPRGLSSYFRPELKWDWYMEGHSGIRDLVSFHGSARVAYRKEQISNRTIRREKLNERLG